MITSNLGTNLFSESIGYVTLELISASRANSNVRATCEPDCYVLEMATYDVVSWLHSLE